MKLNHIDLQVADVQSAASFFEQYFSFTMTTSRASPAIAILRGDDGFTLVIQRRKDDDERYPEGFHVGFIVEDEALVFECHERLSADGVRVSAVQRNGRGTMVYCEAPGEITVEVSCRKPSA